MTRALRFAARLSMFAGIAFVTMNADCDRNITADPTFSDWCGNHLCHWQVDYGTIGRAPTWDKNDFGVSFLGQVVQLDGNDGGVIDAGPPGAQISQLTVESSASCVLFTSVGNFEPAANMTVSADFDNDGTVDFISPLGSAEWTQVQAEFKAPAAYRGITFHVTMSGTADAVLAQLRVQASNDCVGASLQLHDLPVGDVCSADVDCRAGATCHPTDGGPGICSTCQDDGCASGCMQLNPFMPFQCNPGNGMAPTGSACLRGADCLSGICDGAKPTPVALDAGSCDLEAFGDGGDSCNSFGALAGVCR